MSSSGHTIAANSIPSLLSLLFVAIGATVAYIAMHLIKPIVFPTILSYPWPASRNPQRDKSLRVIFAGSFNPPHRGHFSMVKYLANRYGEVVVVVGMNPNKKYIVNPHQRAELLRRMAAGLQNVRVQVVSGYIWRTLCCGHSGSRIFFRGIRSWEKDGKDERHLQILNTIGPILLGPLWWPPKTIFLEGGNPAYVDVSSTMIRELCQDQNFQVQDLDPFVPESIVLDVAKLYAC